VIAVIEEERVKVCGRIRYLVLSFAFVVACLAILVPAIGPASAETWPSRRITVVVPLGAGSASDLMARVVMDQVSRQLGQPIIIENRPGAGGTVGSAIVAKAAPDGYTILAYGALASAHALYSKLPYDTLKDFTPVIALGRQPMVVITSPGKGYKTLGELIAAGKAQPDALNYSSAGIGSASHFGAERLLATAGFHAVHIPFKGAAEAVTDVVAGRSDFSVQLFATTLPLIRDGKLTALALSAPARAAAMPALPTTIEAGLPPDSVYPFYAALFLPAKTPHEIAEKLYAETAKALKEPAVQAKLATLGVEPMAMSMEQFGKFFGDDVAANVAIVKAANIKIQ
jgi:tripartite-type tricarboxylate transporter receptor subunit TctC